jgi:nucleotide-binding universal stress UspA family protein
VTVANVLAQHGRTGETIRAHVATVKADLLVMGGYAHPRMLETVIGGVTNDMLSEAECPVFLSH